MEDDFIEVMQMAKKLSELHLALTALIKLIDLSKLPYNMRLSLTPISLPTGSGFKVELLTQSHDPFSGHSLDFREHVVCLDRITTLKELADATRKAIHISVVHEMDELIFVDSKQAYNPHA